MALILLNSEIGESKYTHDFFIELTDRWDIEPVYSTHLLSLLTTREDTIQHTKMQIQHGGLYTFTIWWAYATDTIWFIIHKPRT